MPEWLLDASAWVLPVLIAVTMHEAAHGWMAEKFGDPTARMYGRVTFNPLKHIDRYGTIIFPGLLLLIHSPLVFGYAKPVPVDFRRLNPPRLGMIMVALAGPGTNILLAIVTGLVLYGYTHAVQIDLESMEISPTWTFLSLKYSLMINCVLAVFNMVPLLPLDGGRVVAACLWGSARAAYDRLERFGMVIIVALLLVPPMLGHNIAQQLLAPPILWVVDAVLWLTGNGGA